MKSLTFSFLLIVLTSSSMAGSGNLGDELSVAANAGTGPAMDVVVDGSHAYVIGRGALQMLDLSRPDQPKILGKLKGLGEVRQIKVRNHVAYIGSRHDGLFIVDVKDPAKPVLLNHYDTVEFATGIALSGDVLFVAHRNFGVELIDVSNPAKPSHLSLVRTGEAQSVVVRDGYLYVGVWAASELVVVDVRNPRQSKITAKVPLDGYGDGVDVAGKYVYVATGHHSRQRPHNKPGDPGFGKGHGLEVFSLQDPAKPRFVSRVKFPPLYKIGNDMWEVVISNHHAFVADTWNGIFVVDVSNPKKMKIVGHCRPPKVEPKRTRRKKSEKSNFIGGITVMKDYILMAGGFSDLHVVRAMGLAADLHAETGQTLAVGKARPAAKFDPQRWRIYQSDGQVYAVDFLDENTAVVACGSAGVHIVRLWPKIKRLRVLPSEGFAMDVSVSNKRILVAESAGGLSIWQVEKSGGFKRVGRFQRKGDTVRQVEAPDSSNRVMVQVGGADFAILDVSDPSNVRTLLKDNQIGLLYGDQMMRGLVEDRYAAIHWHVGGILWYDFKAEPSPVYSGDNLPVRIGSQNGLIALGDRTLATVRGGYVLLDRSERRPLKELDVRLIGIEKQNPGTPNISGNILYTADRSTGLVTITDISDPEYPKPIEHFVTPGNPGRIGISKGRVVIPDGYHGLMVEKPRPPFRTASGALVLRLTAGLLRQLKQAASGVHFLMVPARPG